jgi:hypothetical protein
MAMVRKCIAMLAYPVMSPLYASIAMHLRTMAMGARHACSERQASNCPSIMRRVPNRL